MRGFRLTLASNLARQLARSRKTKHLATTLYVSLKERHSTDDSRLDTAGYEEFEEMTDQYIRVSKARSSCMALIFSHFGSGFSARL
jgi:hypothetical protein